MQSQKRYFPTLDGWRALAVIGVILFHGRAQLFCGHPVLISIARRGYTGVNCFFAISGFLITRLLLDEQERNGSIRLGRFYLRRAFRILPAFYVVVAATAGLHAAHMIDINPHEIPASLLFLRNAFPLSDDTAGGVYTAHFWTLAVEEHFYLAWPLMVVTGSRWLSRATLWIILLATIMRGMFWHVIGPFAVSETWIDGLLWGALAAIHYPRVKRWVEAIPCTNLWIMPAILTLVAMLFRGPEITVFTLLFPILILTTMLKPESVLSRLLELQPLRWLGRLSYSLYLWQQLFFTVRSSHEAFARWQSWPLNLIALIMLATASFYLVEQPLIRWAKTLDWSNLNTGAAKKAAHVFSSGADDKGIWRNVSKQGSRFAPRSGA